MPANSNQYFLIFWLRIKRLGVDNPSGMKAGESFRFRSPLLSVTGGD